MEKDLLGQSLNFITINFFDEYSGFLLASLPPGAFLGLALLIALVNWIDQKNKK